MLFFNDTATTEIYTLSLHDALPILNDMSSALSDDADRNLMLAPFFTGKLQETEASLRQVVAQATLHGLPVPALSAALSYFDIMRTKRSTANMLQGQRDFFGAQIGRASCRERV